MRLRVAARKAPFLGAFFIWGLLAAAAAPAEVVRVKEVVDGDTVVLHDGRSVRLIGINAPETGKHGVAPEPYADEARQRLAALARGREARLSYGRQREDHYGRTLAYVDVGTHDAGADLLAAGLASAIAVPPNLERLQAYGAAEAQARSARKGIWGHRYGQPLAADGLGAADTGYHFVRGRVLRVGESRRNVFLDLAEGFSVMIAHADWDEYFSGRPQQWQGRAIVARGWVTSGDGKLRMRVQHPAMIETAVH